MTTKIEVMDTVEEGPEEIQNYLDNYDELTEQRGTEEEPRTENADEDEDGSYFIDEEGQLYFQPNAAAVTEVPVEFEKPASTTESKSKDESNIESISTVVEEGGEAISYVYIVEEGEEEKAKEENDITVYDFNDEEGEDSGDPNDSDFQVEKKEKPQKPSKQLHNCPHCDYTHVKKGAVIKHMKVHSDNKPYKCSVCNRGFRTQASLVNHENIHTGTKPYHCNACNCKFTTAGEIVRHIRYRHSKIRPHKCNECDYAAVELSKLRRHQRSHTGERPYQCPHCTYASPDTFKLKRHIRVNRL